MLIFEKLLIVGILNWLGLMLGRLVIWCDMLVFCIDYDFVVFFGESVLLWVWEDV